MLSLLSSLFRASMAVFVVVLLCVLFVLCFCSALLRWNEVRYRKKGLPPGTMGWPVFGETTEFLKQGPSFMKNQRARYGSFFKSHILGCPTVVSMDPEVNRYILMNEAKGLVPGYPQSMLDILGKCNIAAVHGSTHKYMRGALLALISSTMIRDQILPKIDDFMRAHLSGWGNQVINIQEKTKEMALLSSLKQIAGIESSSISQAFKTDFFKLVLGTLSLPIDLPGTNYRRGFQARKNIVSMLKQLIEDRRASSEEVHQDMLGGLMRSDDQNRYKLTDEEIIDHIITIMYSGYETVSTTSMMAVKYLHDHPQAIEELRKEHLAIRARKRPEDPIDWNDLKSMRFTRAVIFETSRLATIVNGVLRKTTQDMELNGFLIPKGWRIYVYTRETNYDSFTYPDPLTFNPWRWMDKSLESNNSFIFGGGTRLCPGKELGIAEISTFLHYFVTRYRWEEVGGDKLMKFPRVEAPNGLHIRVSNLTN
ncbi:cytochrome P450 85A-like [Rosa rugosa]|uniref:cytochrome P450 85A-like n=1 Tax=Rosa rugosa TaxID=74645 RepID=UPI002B415BE3|nr:cytochrome P450 85A-like [Rosa rugosa]